MMEKNKSVRLCTVLLFLAILLFFVFLCVASLTVSVGYKQAGKSRIIETIAEIKNTSSKKHTFVIDPGHGGEDPGAVSGVYIEKELNLNVALYMNEFFCLTGENVVMTRTDDVLLYNKNNKEEENRKKFYDLKNRRDIAEISENGIYIGVHMNKFPIESCKGLQVFYSDNNSESSSLAELIQQNAKILDNTNERIIKPDGNKIYILENLDIPAVLIECGFISNPYDAKNLSDEAYQKRLAFIVYCAAEKYLGGIDEN